MKQRNKEPKEEKRAILRIEMHWNILQKIALEMG